MGMFIHGDEWYGDMSYWEKRLEEAGISKDELDANDLRGYTANEISRIVDKAISHKE